MLRLVLSRVSLRENIQAVEALPDVLKENAAVKLVAAGRWALFGLEGTGFESLGIT